MNITKQELQKKIRVLLRTTSVFTCTKKGLTVKWLI